MYINIYVLLVIKPTVFAMYMYNKKAYNNNWATVKIKFS